MVFLNCHSERSEESAVPFTLNELDGAGETADSSLRSE